MNLCPLISSSQHFYSLYWVLINKRKQINLNFNFDFFLFNSNYNLNSIFLMEVFVWKTRPHILVFQENSSTFWDTLASILKTSCLGTISSLFLLLLEHAYVRYIRHKVTYSNTLNSLNSSSFSQKYAHDRANRSCFSLIKKVM